VRFAAFFPRPRSLSLLRHWHRLRQRRGRGTRSSAARTVLMANITRASSPEEAIARKALAGSPGFGAKWNSTVSKPLGATRAGCVAAAGSPFCPLRPRSKRLCLKPSRSVVADGFPENRRNPPSFLAQSFTRRAGERSSGSPILMSRSSSASRSSSDFSLRRASSPKATTSLRVDPYFSSMLESA